MWLLMGTVYSGNDKNCFSSASDTRQLSSNKSLRKSINISIKAKKYKLFDSLCSVETQDSKLKSRNLVLIDVRSKADFEKFRINNSINVPLSQIKIKTFWKTKILVLINSGHDIRPLIEECGRLRKNGFKKIFVYKNGIASWSKDKGTLIGQYSSQDLKGISPEQLFSDRNMYEWVVIDAVDKGNKKQLDKMLTYFSIKIKFSKVNKVKHTGSKRFVFVDNAGDKFNLFSKVKRNNKYYLFGGVERFTDFIFKQYKMTSKKEFTLQKPRSCK